MKTVGIPQGLFYYYYFPLWKTFFECLGAKVITSAPTSKNTANQGIALAVDETCFPVKVYYGHVQELARLGVDYLFIPRIVSVEAKSYICPKFMGMPDMIRASISPLPTLIDITVDLSKSTKNMRQDVMRIGKIFTSSSAKIENAYLKGVQELEFCRTLALQGYTMAEAIDLWLDKDVTYKIDKTKELLSIGVLGHGYSLYDSLISLNLIERLRRWGCRVYTPENLPETVIEDAAATLPKRIFWTLGRKMMGSALYLDNSGDVDGIIYMACFGCGPDSMVGEMIERKIKHKPFMLLTVDEHTGEAGIATRMEAFCDVLRRRKDVPRMFSVEL